MVQRYRGVTADAELLEDTQVGRECGELCVNVHGAVVVRVMVHDVAAVTVASVPAGLSTAVCDVWGSDVCVTIYAVISVTASCDVRGRDVRVTIHDVISVSAARDAWGNDVTVALWYVTNVTPECGVCVGDLYVTIYGMISVSATRRNEVVTCVYV